MAELTNDMNNIPSTHVHIYIHTISKHQPGNFFYSDLNNFDLKAFHFLLVESGESGKAEGFRN